MTSPTPRTSNRTAQLAAIALFIALAVASNWLTSRYGLVSVGFGLVSAGTFTAGAAFLVRDWVHEQAGLWAVVGCIVAGSALSAVTAGPVLAVASGVAFLLSEAADLAVYAPLRRRSTWLAVLASNTVGAIFDSIVFLTLAGFGLTWASASGQVAVKVAVTVPAVIALAVRRSRSRRKAGPATTRAGENDSVLRDSVGPKGA